MRVLSELAEIQNACNNLSSTNLGYIKAIATTLKFTENIEKIKNESESEPKKERLYERINNF